MNTPPELLSRVRIVDDQFSVIVGGHRLTEGVVTGVGTDADHRPTVTLTLDVFVPGAQTQGVVTFAGVPLSAIEPA